MISLGELELRKIALNHALEQAHQCEPIQDTLRRAQTYLAFLTGNQVRGDEHYRRITAEEYRDEMQAGRERGEG